MSIGITIAEAMVERLASSGGFRGVTVLVDQQLDIDTEIEKALGMAAGKAKGAGAFVSVFYEGFANPDSSGANNPVIIRSYQVSIYAAPILSSSNQPADSLMETAATVLHSWEPGELGGISEITVKSGLARPDNNYLIYDLSVEVSSRLK
jgi:hypothetical protein